MNFRLYLLLPVALLTFFAACAKKEKAAVDLRVDEKFIEIKQDEVRIEEADKDIVSGQPATQIAPQKMSDNSEITVMFDGFGNKLEKRYFKGHPRLNSVLIRTAADGRREIIVYGQNGERKSVDGDLMNRLMNAPADEIANNAKIYETRPVFRKRAVIAESQQTKPETQVLPPVTPPAVIQQPETTTEEQIEKTPQNTDSNGNPPTGTQKEQVKEETKDKENK
jgi:hypothetical protein